MDRTYVLQSGTYSILNEIYSKIPYSAVFDVAMFALYFGHQNIVRSLEKSSYNVYRHIITQYDTNRSVVLNNEFVKVNEEFVRKMIMSNILYDADYEIRTSEENVIELLDTHGFHFTELQLSQLRGLSQSFKKWIDQYYKREKKSEKRETHDECDELCMVCDMGKEDGVVVRRLPCFHTHVLCNDCITQLHKVHRYNISSKCAFTHVYKALCETCNDVFVSDKNIARITCPMCRTICAIEIDNEEKKEDDEEAEQPNGGDGGENFWHFVQGIHEDWA